MERQLYKFEISAPSDSGRRDVSDLYYTVEVGVDDLYHGHSVENRIPAKRVLPIFFDGFARITARVLVFA